MQTAAAFDIQPPGCVPRRHLKYQQHYRALSNELDHIAGQLRNESTLSGSTIIGPGRNLEPSNNCNPSDRATGVCGALSLPFSI